MVDLLVKNARFLVCDARTIIEDGAVAIEKNRIVDVGKTEELKKKYKADKVIDARWKVVMPGLVNCHMHGAENLFTGLYTDLADRFTRFVVPSQFFFNNENTYSLYLLTYADMIKSGTTCYIDMYFFPDAMCRAASASGLRANVASYVFDCKAKELEINRNRFMDAANPEEQLRNIEVAIKNWHNADNGRIRLMYGIHTVVDSSPEHVLRVRENATRHKVGITVHVNESLSELRMGKELYGKRPLEHLYDLGILGPDVAAVHCIWLTSAEMEMIRQTGTTVVHNPKNNMMMGKGVCPVPELLEKGVPVALGSDGIGYSGEIDMFNNMKLTALLHTLNKMDFKAMPAPTVFELATLGGARAVGLEKDIGSIEKGKKADLLLLDVKQLRFFPIRKESIMYHLVYTVSGEFVDTVIVDGKILMEGRQLKTLNESAVLENAQNEAERFKSKFLPKIPGLKKISTRKKEAPSGLL